MTHSKGKHLKAFGTGTAFLWNYALMNFISLSVTGKEFNLIFAFIFFFAALTVTRGLYGKGIRIITIIFLHLICILFFIFLFIHTVFQIDDPFFRFSWINQFFSYSRDVNDWFYLVVTLILPFILWIAGIRNALKENDYMRSCNRMDIGIAFFFVIFLIRMLLRTSSDIIIDDVKTIKLFYAFFILALGSIALSKNKGSAEKFFMVNHRGTGILLMFLLIFLSLISVIFLVLLPELSSAAESGYKVLSRMAEPAENILVLIIMFLFNRKKFSPGGSTVTESGVSQGTAGVSDEHSFLGTILIWLMNRIIILAGVLIFGIIIWFVLKKILRKTAKVNKTYNKRSILEILGMLLENLKKMVLILFKGVLRPFRGYKTVEELYGSLLRWGRLGGRPREKNETPVEYQNRLTSKFDFAGEEIECITTLFVNRYYAMAEVDSVLITTGIKSLRRIKSPRFLFLRIKAWVKR